MNAFKNDPIIMCNMNHAKSTPDAQISRKISINQFSPADSMVCAFHLNVGERIFSGHV